LGFAGLAVLASGNTLAGWPARADMTAAQSAITAGNFPAAGAALQPLADAGDTQAQYQWAALALDGHPVGLAPDHAMSLLIEAAAQGNSHAQARLGMAYANGDHIVADNFAAYHWLSRASAAADLTDAERSNVDAMRQSLLKQLAPAQQSNADLIAANAAVYAALPPPSDAKPDSISAAHLTPPKPLPPVTDDATADDATTATPDKTATHKANAKPTSASSAKKTKVATSSTAKPATATEIATAAALPADPAPAVQTTPADSQTRHYLVQLASLPTEDAANTEADRLRKKYAAILQGTDISVRQADLGTKGIVQRVVVGPFDNFSDAKTRCNRFSAQKQACRVVVATN
jgi:cell division septation protein DedD